MAGIITDRVKNDNKRWISSKINGIRAALCIQFLSKPNEHPLSSGREFLLLQNGMKVVVPSFFLDGFTEKLKVNHNSSDCVIDGYLVRLV